MALPYYFVPENCQNQQSILEIQARSQSSGFSVIWCTHIKKTEKRRRKYVPFATVLCERQACLNLWLEHRLWHERHFQMFRKGYTKTWPFIVWQGRQFLCIVSSLLHQLFNQTSWQGWLGIMSKHSNINTWKLRGKQTTRYPNPPPPAPEVSVPENPALFLILVSLVPGNVILG